MNLETLFSIAGAIALPGWLLLIFVPWWRWATQLIAPFVIPLILALMYAYLMVTNLANGNGNFHSLAGVRGLFEVDALLLAGWIHYLAFDLFIGSWEVRDSRRRGISHLLIVPCLIGTFMLGPIGLALYFAIRAAMRRTVWIDDGVAGAGETAAVS
ncbi:MAG TPA: ABA4-like family protein [Pirellulales bacterium]|nr:ABA4-like family protein [Pirellulales bacterium]